jgi:hypothetical protein
LGPHPEMRMSIDATGGVVNAERGALCGVGLEVIG